MDNGVIDGSLAGRPLFFCGIGGSGMLPLAQIAKGLGHPVAGSDRSRDQGRTPEKFAWLAANGFDLFPQDGSGVTSPDQILIASAAIEETVPEVARAKALGCQRMSRAELLALLLMNGAVMKNFVTPENPFASARVGRSPVFVSEVDESDGSIALYRPTIGVLLNVSIDHKSIEELRVLFGDFLAASGCAVVNLDNLEAGHLRTRNRQQVTFGIQARDADITVEPDSIDASEFGIRAAVIDNERREVFPLILPMPGMHNLSNALAAIAATSAAGINVGFAAYALRSFQGLARRFDLIGISPSNIKVIDDFGHNPEKCAATLQTLKATPGRVIAFFQPHGYGPLRQMGRELAETFARALSSEDITILCDPVYFGGTVDRSEGSEQIVDLINGAGGRAEHIAARSDCADRIVALAQPGDRIVVMGARDDTLTEFAQSLLARLP